MAFLRRMLGIDPQPNTNPRRLPDGAVVLQLAQRVKADMIADFAQLGHLCVGIGGAEDVVFAAKLFVCQARFV